MVHCPTMDKSKPMQPAASRMHECAALLRVFCDHIGATISGCKNAPHPPPNLESEDVCHVADAAQENYPSPWGGVSEPLSLSLFSSADPVSKADTAESPLKDVPERQVLLYLALDGILQGQGPRNRKAGLLRLSATRACGFQFAEPEDCAQTARATRSTPKMSSGEYKRMDNTILGDPRMSMLLPGRPCHNPLEADWRLNHRKCQLP